MGLDVQRMCVGNACERLSGRSRSMHGVTLDGSARLVPVEESQKGAGLLGRVPERRSSRKGTARQMGSPPAKIKESCMFQKWPVPEP